MNDVSKMNITPAAKLDDVDDLRSMVNRMASDIYALGRLVEDLQENEDRKQQAELELAKVSKPSKPAHQMGKRDHARSELILDSWVTINVICALAKIKHHTAENLLWRLRRADEYHVETRPCKGYERMYRVTKVAA